MKFPLSRGLSAFAPMCIASPAFSAAPPKKEEVEDPDAPVSYFKRVRLIFQAECQGCHQPAKAKGG
jgi:mono/diheme cytochrome c family protein